MDEQELKLLWQSGSEKLESSLRVNKNNTVDITRLKARNFLASMKPTKIFTLIAGVIWVAGLGSILIYLTNNHLSDISLFFLISASIQVMLTAITIGVYVYQIGLINNIDFDEPVLTIQEKISKLKISTLNVTRLLFLQLPVWTTFYWNQKMFVAENWFLWILQGIVTLSFTYAALWLFFNIRYENQNKKWFRLIFRGKEWLPLLQAMELLNQIQEYQKPEYENDSH